MLLLFLWKSLSVLFMSTVDLGLSLEVSSYFVLLLENVYLNT